MTKLDYDHKNIEKKWQKKWEEQGLYVTPKDVARDEKCYILPQLPYPSGEGLHVGHTSVYTPCDVYARFQRMRGKKVLQVVGWDSFGLPAENFAIKHNVHPRERTTETLANFEGQIRALGCALDWDRAVASHQPSYYKWTQWFFLFLYEKGLAYRKKQLVNWCPGCQTVLANEQTAMEATSGERVCERCESLVAQKEMEQWFFKITDYADRLSQDLDKVDWPEESVKRQRDWIGRSEGALVKFQITCLRRQANNKLQTGSIEVFTTRPDTFFGCTFLVLAPDGSFVKQNVESFPNAGEVKDYVRKSQFKTELERMSDKTKTGVATGLSVINPFNQEEIPVFVADFALGSVGTGAVAGVPGHDTRDFEFAKVYDLPVRRVVIGPDSQTGPIEKSEDVMTELGISYNSNFLDGLPTSEAKSKATEYAQENGFGEAKVTYKLRDWSVSRQRFWGAPIPIVYDPEGNPHPVAEDDLPVVLPDDVDFKPTGESPLKNSVAFQSDVEKKYGQGWRREVDTLDTFVCSSWYYYRYLDPHNDKEFASQEALKTWMPVDFYLGGREHVNGHLLYSRFLTKVLFDAGLVNFDEPFLVHRHQGTIWGPDGRIMSKRYGNVINPTDVMEEYGADVLRLYQLFLGPLEASKPWNVEGIKGVSRFLDRVVKYSLTNFAEGGVDEATQNLVNQATPLMGDLKFNVVIAKMMETLNVFEQARPSRESWETFLKVLAPFAPHLTEELWEALGHTQSIHLETWPESRVKEKENNTIIVQVNGKLKGTLEMGLKESLEEDIVVGLVQMALTTMKDIKPKKTIFVPGKLVNFVVEKEG